MKKIILSLLTAASLVSCSVSSEYTITGTIDGAIDGDSVVLGYSANGSDFTAVEKTVIENGQFTFNGEVSGSKIYYIGYEKAIEPIYTLFFLEGGNINMEIAAEGNIVSGTPANDLNMQVEEQLATHVNKLLEYQIQLYTDTLISDSAKAALNLAAMEVQRDASIYVKDVIEKNIGSIMGLFLLVQYADLFDTAELNVLIEKIPEENIDRDNNCLYDILQEIISDRNQPHKSDVSYDEALEAVLDSFEDATE